MAVQMTAQLDLDGAFTVVETAGALGVADAPEVRRRLTAVMRVGSPRVVLDLTGAQAVDPGLAGMLCAVHRQAAMQGGWLRVVTWSPELRSELADARDEGLYVVASRRDGLADVHGQARRPRQRAGRSHSVGG